MRGTKWGAAVSVVLIGSLSAGCDIEPPEVPTFHTQVTIPISERSYSVLELIEDVEGIEIEGDQIRLAFEGAIDTVSVDDELSASIAGFSVSAELGPFDLADDLNATTAFTFADLAPPGTPTGSTIVPPFTFSVPPQDATGLDDVSQVVFDSGQLVVEVSNGMAIPLSGSCGATPGFHAVIEDVDSGTILLDWQVTQEIGVGETRSTSQPLAGVTLGSAVRVTVSGCTPGSGGQVVTVDAADEIAIDIRLENAVASSATSTVPSQSFVQAGSADWDADLSLQQALVQTGSVDVTFTNNTPLVGDVVLGFDGFTLGGAPLVLTTQLAAGATSTVPFDLSGAVFDSPTPVTAISYTATVTTQDTGTNQVTLMSTDGVSVVADSIDLDLEWVVGVPDALEETFGPFAETIEWPDETDGLLPAAASVTLTIHNEIGASVNGSLLLRGSNESEADSLTHTFAILPGSLGSAVTTTVVMDETNSDILDILAFYPTDLEITGNLEIGDGVSTIRLDRGAIVGGDYSVSAPFAFTVTGATIEIDPFSVDLDEDLRELLIENVGDVAIEATLVNGFPFGADALLTFDVDSTEVFTNPMVTLAPVSAPAAEVDGSGKAEEATTANNALSLTEEEVETLAEPTIFVGVRLTLQPSSGVVLVSPENEAAVRSALVLDVTIDDGLLGGD